MQILSTTTVDNALYQDALQIRKAVFIDEQGIAPSIELDDLDPSCRHFVLYEDDTPVATARILPLEKNSWKIQRVAVLYDYRKQKLGATLLKAVIQAALESGITRLVLGAQKQTRGFYEQLGFVKVGDEFIEAGIPHLHMEKIMSVSQK